MGSAPLRGNNSGMGEENPRRQKVASGDTTVLLINNSCAPMGYQFLMTTVTFTVQLSLRYLPFTILDHNLTA